MHERLITHQEVTAFIPDEYNEDDLIVPVSPELAESLENERSLDLYADARAQRHALYMRMSRAVHEAELAGEEVEQLRKAYIVARSIFHETKGHDVIGNRADFDAIMAFNIPIWHE